MQAIPKVGERAPDFALPASTGRVVSLSDYAGRWLVLYFYPKSFTPNCTRETLYFRNNAAELLTYGADVVGVSPDGLPTQCEFAEKLAVSFPLLADEDGRMCRTYGVRWPLIPLVRRVTFVVGPDAVVRAVFHHEHQLIKAFDPIRKFLAQATASPQPL